MKKDSFKVGLGKRFMVAFDEVLAKSGVTEKELCATIPIPAPYTHQIRGGKRAPTLEQVIAFCDKYKYDPLYILAGRSKASERKASDNITLEHILEELIQQRQLQAKQYEQIMQELADLRKQIASPTKRRLKNP